MDRHQYTRPQREKSQLQMCYANYPKSSKSPCPLNGAGVHGFRNEIGKHEISEAMEYVWTSLRAGEARGEEWS